MPVLAKLDQEESDILVHMMQNKNKTLNSAEQNSQTLIDMACSTKEKERLAKISEEQNFAAKNRYVLDQNLIKYGKKERMPIDAAKVKDILRNQHHVRTKINEDVGTYSKYQENTNFDNGVLTYVNEAAWGDLRDLLKDIGINRETIRYSNVADLVKAKDDRVYESDFNFNYLM